MHQRIKKVREILRNRNLDSLFVSNQYNVSYLTGFSGLAPDEREGFFFITKSNAYLLTFPTYYGLFKNAKDGFTILNITIAKRLKDHLLEIIYREKIKTLGFEKTNLTIAEHLSLKEKLKVSLMDTEDIVEDLRVIKDEEELHSIKKAALITDRAFDFIKKKIKKGLTEKDIALEIEFFLKKHADGIAFSPIVAFNENAAIPHYLPTTNYKLRTNSLILLDFGARINGYCADMTRIIFLGSPTNSQTRIYKTVLKAQSLALETLKVGVLGGKVDKIARDYIISSGFPEYPHGLGHGVGLAIHEAPRLKKDGQDILKENMVVTVEPGIYIEGNCGVRIEDLVVMKKKGISILSRSSKELIIL